MTSSNILTRDSVEVTSLMVWADSQCCLAHETLLQKTYGVFAFNALLARGSCRVPGRNYLITLSSQRISSGFFITTTIASINRTVIFSACDTLFGWLAARFEQRGQFGNNKSASLYCSAVLGQGISENYVFYWNNRSTFYKSDDRQKNVPPFCYRSLFIGRRCNIKVIRNYIYMGYTL